jgi:predicted RNase H-like HicB family nuclease
MNELMVYAMWDAEAGVWVATSEEVPGLATEADTVEKLIAKLKVMIPELLEANGYPLNGPAGTPALPGIVEPGGVGCRASSVPDLPSWLLQPDARL